MTEKLKCPICGKDLIEIEFGKRWFLACDNSKCRCKGVASYVVWEYIDRTRRALDVAVDALIYANKCLKGGCVNWETHIDKALKQITALEQKD